MRLVFTGAVLPERASVNISEIEMTAELPEFEVRVKVLLSIGASRISCVVEVERNIDIWTLRNVVDQMVASVVDAFGFTTGRGYDIEIQTSTDPISGEHTVYGVDIPVLENSAAERPIDVAELLSLANTAPVLHRALADLRLAAREAGDSGFFAYRAVETLRHHFPLEADTDAARSAQWDRLRTTLGVDRSVFDFMKRWADPQRHGLPLSISDVERAKVLHLAWTVVYRFCLLLKNDPKARPDEGVLDLK